MHTISKISCLVYHEFYVRHSLSSFSTSVSAVFRSSVIWSAFQVYPSVIDSVRRLDSQSDILSDCSSVSPTIRPSVLKPFTYPAHATWIVKVIKDSFMIGHERNFS